MSGLLSHTFLQKEGHLYKYRNVLKGWEYRYFKLSRDYFHYYSAQHVSACRIGFEKNLSMEWIG